MTLEQVWIIGSVACTAAITVWLASRVLSSLQRLERQVDEMREQQTKVFARLGLELRAPDRSERTEQAREEREAREARARAVTPPAIPVARAVRR
jgi:hypothetical protein